MSGPPGAPGPHDTLLAALHAADAPVDPAHPSGYAADRAEYATALHLEAPVAPAAATSRTLQRVAAFGITATALLVIGSMGAMRSGGGTAVEGEPLVKAWRVSGKGAEPMRPRDFVQAGDMLQFSVTADSPRQVNVWLRDAEGKVEAWFPAGGARIEAGERVPIEHHTIFGAATGTYNVAVQVCSLGTQPGPDPWTDVLPPEGCRPFLFTLKNRS